MTYEKFLSSPPGHIHISCKGVTVATFAERDEGGMNAYRAFCAGLCARDELFDRDNNHWLISTIDKMTA